MANQGTEEYETSRRKDDAMSAWTGAADCPNCGCEGTLLVHGETSTLEIDGCWVCGCGRPSCSSEIEFIPLKRLKVQERAKQYRIAKN
jgi:hypothetical protein